MGVVACLLLVAFAAGFLRAVADICGEWSR